MAKPRVYEIAKDLNLSSKEIIKVLKNFDKEVKNHMSTLEETDMDIVLDYYTQQQNEKNKNTKENVKEKVKGNEDKKANNIKEEKKEQETEKITDQNNQDENYTANKRHYNLRQTVVNLEKYDTEKIENLVDEEVFDAKAERQKIKKKPKGKKSNIIKEDVVIEKEKTPKKKKKIVKIAEDITVGEFAEKANVPAAEVIKNLMSLGVMANVNQNIDYDTASLIGEEMGIETEKEIIMTDEQIILQEQEDKPEDLKPRSPVVVVMGHVDHGKTSLLDAIRQTNITATEAGGITQHIGAYRVNINGKDITFLDTPGHEAFTAMRARGAQVTDIAILVVAADDGIMPQTIEAINHAKAAKVNIIIAINKIDKEGANPDRIKQQLTEHGLVPEDWGGDTICVPVSAVNKDGIDDLLEMVLLIAEMQELKANPNKKARGAVIESKLDKGRGPVATVLVQKGTLKVGDVIIAGTANGKIRAMFNDIGKKTDEAGPSEPVEILGLSEVPAAGDDFYAVEDEKVARSLVENRKEVEKEELIKSRQKVSLENLFSQIKEGEIKELNVVLKADVQGSVEAVKQSLEKLTNEEVRVNIIHNGVGAVNESDVMLALTSNAIIVGFNVRPNPGARESAERQDVEIRLYRVIYEAIEEMEAAMKGLLAPKYKEVLLGHAEVRATFKVSGVGTIAGCYVTDGKILRNASVRVVRDGIVIHEGTLASLKRFKDDAKEVASGYECGIGVEKFNDIKEGDVIEAYNMEEVKR